ncbi:hypothetical protein [Xanthomonas sp. 10-10]|uniref:Uncharacterized protein n=1 Tax=Xanthomonas sp. 10-10 TaxID=3115848 RepID=A0AAU7P4Z8_9XANT
MSDPSDLLVQAFRKFQTAGYDITAAKNGLHGFWVERSVEATVAHSALERVMVSSKMWAQKHPSLSNPYQDVARLFSAGATLGRWENNVLDVFLPDGQKYGMPLASLMRAASNNSFKPNPLRGSA